MKWLYLLPLLLVGCAHTPEQIVRDNYVLIPVDCEDFTKQEPVRALPVVFVEAETADGYKVLGLRGDMYSNLSIILRDTLRYIEGQNKAIDYYEGCIERHNSINLNEEGEPE